MPDSYSNEERYFFQENTCDIELFAPPFFNYFILGLIINKMYGNESQDKKP